MSHVNPELLSQLSDVFSNLSETIELALDVSDHPQQGELEQMLTDVAKSSDKIKIISSTKTSLMPGFTVKAKSAPGDARIRFTGIPGGHEFTSFVLAILNSGGIGKMPDDGLKARIRRITKPIHIKTFISLTCENCPDVVQALNQLALIHPQITHEMIDGGYVQDEIDRLKIQGVPSVVVGDQLIHSGRATLADLVNKLEQSFADNDVEQESRDLGHFDVVVVGGGPAGASAAIYSVRKGLKTAIIADRIGGQMLETKGIENFSSVTYTEGLEMSSNLDKHLRAYPIVILEHRRVASVQKSDDPKAKTRLEVVGGETLTTDSLIVASGAKWRELGVPGEKEYIGRGVAFCPHCDGPYYKGKDVAVVGGGNSGVEAAIDLAGICKSVTLIEFADQLKADRVLIDKAKSLPNVQIITHAKTRAILGDGSKVTSLEWENRSNGEVNKIDLDGVFVQIGLSPNSGFVSHLVQVNRFGEIIVDEKGRTNVAGVYAAGDVTTVPYKQIVIAMGEGAKVALTSFEDRMRSAS